MDITEVRPSEKTAGILRVLRSDGSTDPENDPLLDLPMLRSFYSAMVRMRTVEAGLARMHDAGEITFHTMSEGFEASVVGSALAMAETDWMFPAHRELGALLFRGVPLTSYLDHVLGNRRDVTKGHSMPGYFSGKDYRIASVSAPTGGHLTQAVGYAWAAEKRRAPIGVLAFLNESSIDAAEFHNALNFAGVFKANVVFACHSTGERDTDISENCHAYGLPAVTCDGTDALAVYESVRGALERARADEGPTLVELRRTGGDPVLRLHQHLGRHGWTDADEDQLSDRLEREFDEALSEARKAGPPGRDSLFDSVFEERPAHLPR